ncbi:DUF1616 domain-containing protein [Methanobacterium oryzae]|uniref:DUF1616 domain-containing protein n=1 Tax=Methanobacterium oryzae TaxID=69540 RepID=UPI003D1DE482
MKILPNIDIILISILTLISFTSLKLPSKSIFITLTLFTILFSVIALIRRKRIQKISNRYLICRECNGIYKLKPGESLKDFESCLCGGKLEYTKHIPKSSVSKNKSYIPLKTFKIQRKSERNFNKKTKFKSRFLLYDLLLVLIATTLCIIFVITPKLNDTPIRIILGLLFILFLPGYSLIAALFPKKVDLDGVERLALSFGLSIAVTPLIGLLLNYTPFGIRLTPILISLSAFTVLMCIIAYIRRLKTPEDERFTVKFRYHLNNITKEFRRGSKTDRILSIILVFSIVLAISATIYIIVTPKEGEKFTEFYILGPNGKASDYPTNLTVGGSGTVLIGIVNHEYENVNYKLMVKLGNQTIKEENISLAKNMKYENQFNFTAGPGEKQELEFLLYKLPDNRNVYRSLHLWINAR